MSEISINIIISSLNEAIHIYHFNYVLKRYKRYVIDSERLYTLFKNRVELVIEKHATPKEAVALQDMLEEIETDRRNRIEFLISSGKPVVDIFNTVIKSDNKVEAPKKTKTKAVIQSEEVEPKLENFAKISQRLDRLEGKLDIIISMLSSD